MLLQCVILCFGHYIYQSGSTTRGIHVHTMWRWYTSILCFIWNTEYRVKLALEKIHKNNETYVINLFLINISRKKQNTKNKQHMKGTKYILWRSCANNRKKSLWTWVIEMFSWIWNKKANWRLKRPNDTSRHGDEENYRRKISIYSLLNTDTFQNV